MNWASAARRDVRPPITPAGGGGALDARNYDEYPPLGDPLLFGEGIKPLRADQQSLFAGF